MIQASGDLFLNVKEEITIYDKIFFSMRNLDLVTGYKEQINEKNKPSNLNRDMLHVLFGSKARFFVSNDVKTRKKAKITYRALNIKTKVLSLEEFIYISFLKKINNIVKKLYLFYTIKR